MIKNLDTNGDGQISKEEFTNRTATHFDRMDINGDGFLSEDEVPSRSGKREASAKRGKRAKSRGAGRLVLLADADKSQNVTGEEWTTFFAAISAEDGLNVDPKKLMALLPNHGDRGGRDGGRRQIALADLQSRFDRMDRNDDGQISEDEFPKRHSKAEKRGALSGLLLIQAADGDDEPGVSAQDWSTFLDSLEVDETGVVDAEALATRISSAHAVDAEGHRRPPFYRIFDNDGDGSLEIDDLQAVFEKLDNNGDGAINEEELTPPRRHRRRK